MKFNIPNILIFFIITLMCSTTPISAAMQNEIQVENNSNATDIDWTVTWQDTVDKMADLMENNRDIELTDEQSNYLDTRLDDLQTKSDNILDNVQNAFNYVILKDSEYDNFTNSSNKTTLIKDSYSDDLRKTADYLSQTYTITTTQNNYSVTTRDYMGNNTTTGFIVQVRYLGYVRYMNVIFMNDDIITLSSPHGTFTYNSSDFRDKMMVGDNLNVIRFNSSQTNSSTVLNNIINFQNANLNEDLSHNNAIITATFSVGGTALASIFVAALWKPYDHCRRTGVPLQDVEDEGARLINNKMGNMYWDNFERAAQSSDKIRSCGKWLGTQFKAAWFATTLSTKAALGVIGTGIATITACTVLNTNAQKLKTNLENDIANLNSY